MISNQIFVDQLTNGWIADRDTTVRTRYLFGAKAQNVKRTNVAAKTLITDPLITDYFARRFITQ